MPDLFDISVTLSTPGEPLELNDHEAFELVDWNPPIQDVTLGTIAGPYQSGDVLVSATRAPGRIAATIRVLGSSWSDQQANLATLKSALSQWGFTVTETIEGEGRVFACKPSNLVYADGVDGFQVARSRHEYVLSIPCNPPTPVEGS